MKKQIIASIIGVFVFCQAFLLASEESQDAPQLHICTVASQDRPGLQQLLDSCRRYNVSIDLLGYGLPFRGNGENLLHVQNYLEAFPETDIVMFIDAYDVLFMDNANSILAKFLEMKVPFVISAERYCWPFSNKAAEFTQSDTSFKYINAGSYIGYISHLKEILKEMSPISPTNDDQGTLTAHFLKNKEKYAFDSKCELFMPLAGVIKGDLDIDCNNKSVKCLETGKLPCLIHGNGGSRPLYQDIYNMLYIDNP